MGVISDTVMCTVRRNIRTKVTMTLLCTLTYCFHHLLGVGEGFAGDSDVLPHLTYTFLHANVWHLFCNLLVLWSIRSRIESVGSFVIAFAASWLPMYVVGPTVGLSGWLFAAFGIMWGRAGRLAECLRIGLPFIVLTMLLPNVNGTLHLYCYLTGFVYGAVAEIIRKNKCS